MRLPRNLKLPDHSACASAVLANTLYMFECTPTPDIAAADKMLQRQPKQAAYLRIDLPCLQHGLKVCAVAPYDPADIAEADIEYSHGQRDRLARRRSERIAKEAHVQKQLAQFRGNRYTFILARPTARDLYRAVFTPNTIVKISLRRGKRYRHAILLHALHNDGKCWVFDPASRPIERVLSPRDLKRWHTDAGMIVVSK